jgi:hypothetical protein
LLQSNVLRFYWNNVIHVSTRCHAGRGRSRGHLSRQRDARY